MKNNAKRLLAFLLAALLCVTMVVPVFATETEAEHDHVHEVVCPEGCKHECDTDHTKESDSVEVIEVVPPQCTNAGYTLKYCFDCKHYVVTDPVPADPDAVHVPGKEPVIAGQTNTCMTEGVEATYECTVCHAKCDKDGGDVDVLPATGEHTYKDSLCIYCGRHENDECKGPHTWDFAEVVLKPTDKENGIATYICKNVVGTTEDGKEIICGAKKEVVILAENERIYPSSLYANIDFVYDEETETFKMIDREEKLELALKGATIKETDVTHNGTTIKLPTLNAGGTNVAAVKFNVADNFWNNFSFEVLYLCKGTASAVEGVFCGTENLSATGRGGVGIASTAANVPYFCLGLADNTYLSVYASKAASKTEFVHIVTTAAVVNGTLTAKIYMNGELSETGTKNSVVEITDLHKTLILGADTKNSDKDYDFKNDDISIADVKVYSAALTEKEVETLYGYVVEDFTEDTTPEDPEHKCTIEAVPAKDGTCTEKSTLAHFACTDKECGKLYADKEGKTEITKDDTVGDYKHAFAFDEVNGVYVPATCDTWGYKVLGCTECGVLETEKYPPLGHAEWDDEDRAIIDTTKTKLPTCETPGTVVWNCICGKYEGTKEVAALGHDKVTVPVDATCATVAYEFTYCKNGDRCNLKEATIPATGVPSVVYVVKVNKDGDEVDLKGTDVHVIEFKLTGKEVAPDKHYNVIVVKVEATCTTDGYVLTYCEGCEVLDNYEVLPKVDHVYEDKKVTDATCTSPATYDKVCKFCGDVKEAGYTKDNVLGHKLGEEKLHAATCSTKGYKYKVCELCKAEVVTVKDIAFVPSTDANGIYTDYATAKGDHPSINDEKDGKPYREGSCEFVGLLEYECAACKTAGKNHLIYVQTGVGGKGHTFVPDTNDKTPAKDATCTEPGYIPTQKCSECDAVKPGTGIVTEALKHELVEVKESEPTCTEDGAYAHYHCTRENCGANFEDAEGTKEITTNVVKPAEGHKFILGKCTVCGFECKHEGTFDRVDEEESIANCKGKGTYGYIHYGCSACGYECWNDFVDIPAHELEDKKVDPTCTTEGATWKECKNCGDKFDEVVLPMVHTNKDGETILDSCVDEVEDRVCVDCGETIGKACHPVTITVEQDCQNKGYTVVACADCGDVKSTVANTEFGAHKLSTEAIKVEPTYTTEGSITAVCLVCGENVVEKIPVKSGLNIELEASNKYADNEPNKLVEFVDGSYVVVKVFANANNLKVWSFKLKVNYDNTVLDFVAKYNAEDKEDASFVSTNICGTTTSGVVTDKGTYVTIVGVASNNDKAEMQDIALNGDNVLLATLVFRVTTDAATKADADFTVDFDAVDGNDSLEIIDKAGNDIDAELREDKELSVSNDEITTDLYLDINRDGVRDLEDLNAMATILAKVADEKLNFAAADANHDGFVTDSDLALLLQLLAEAKTYNQVIGRK